LGWEQVTAPDVEVNHRMSVSGVSLRVVPNLLDMRSLRPGGRADRGIFGAQRWVKNSSISLLHELHNFRPDNDLVRVASCEGGENQKKWVSSEELMQNPRNCMSWKIEFQLKKASACAV